MRVEYDERMEGKVLKRFGLVQKMGENRMIKRIVSAFTKCNIRGEPQRSWMEGEGVVDGMRVE